MRSKRPSTSAHRYDPPLACTVGLTELLLILACVCSHILAAALSSVSSHSLYPSTRMRRLYSSSRSTSFSAATSARPLSCWPHAQRWRYVHIYPLKQCPSALALPLPHSSYTSSLVSRDGLILPIVGWPARAACQRVFPQQHGLRTLAGWPWMWC